MANSNRPCAIAEIEGGRDAHVCGVDLTGFSRWVEGEFDRQGAKSLEALADDLSGYLAGASAILADAGFQLGTWLGDGLLAVDFGPKRDRAAIETRIRAAINQFEPNARIAFGEGLVNRRVFAGLPGTSHAVLAGPAVRQCYQALDAYPRTLETRPAPAPVRPSIARIETAEICEAVVGFLAFRSADFADLEAFIAERLPAWQASALAAWGELDRLSFDDDAMLLRFVWPTAVIDEKGAAMFLAGQLHDCPPSLQCAWGAGSGPIFRARMAKVASLTGAALDLTEGPAINRAAKQAKRALVSGGSVAPGLASTTASDSQRHSALIGRQAELAWIAARMAAGRRLITVLGEAGIGKSSTIAMAAAARAHDADVISLVAAPGAILEPLGLWRTAAQVDIHLAVDQQIAAIRQQLAVRARRRPLLIVIDDLQWADAYSRKLTDDLVRGEDPITILAAARPGAAALVNSAIPDDILTLSGMPAEDIAALARLHCDQPDPLIARVVGGNPFLAVQLALESRLGTSAERQASSLSSTIDLRLARLAPAQIALARLLAVIDQELDPAGLKRVCDACGIAFGIGALQTLREEKFVAMGSRSGSLTLAHRLIQQRIVEQMPPSAMLRLSAVLGRLSRTDPDLTPALGVVGAHLRNAQQWARAAAADRVDAERALAIHAHASAAALFERSRESLARLAARPDRMALIQASIGLANWGAGKVAEAFSAAGSASTATAQALGGTRRLRAFGAVAFGNRAMLPPRLELALVRQAALRSELGYFSGKLTDILAGGLVVSRLSKDSDAFQLARTRSLGLLALGIGLIGLKQPARAILAHCQRANGDTLPAAYAYCAEALYHFANGAWDDGERCVAESEARLGTPRDYHLQGALLCIRALALHLRGATGQSLEVFDALLQLGKQRDNGQFKAWAMYGSAMPLIAAGRVAEAASGVDQAYAFMSDNGDPLSVLNCLALRSQLAWIAGDAGKAIDQAELCIAQARAIFPVNFGSVDGFALPALILAEIIGDAQTAPSDRAKAQALLPDAMAQSRRFAARCPIGRPRLEAAQALLTRGKARHVRHSSRMTGLSGKFGMPLQLLSAQAPAPPSDR